MRYLSTENPFITVRFTTGDTVTIDIYDLSDDSKVVDGVTMSEVVSTGYFKYLFNPNISTLKEYLYITTNTIEEHAGKIILGGYPDDINQEIRNATVTDDFASLTKFESDLPEHDEHHWERGAIKFTSGQNEGVIRKIQDYSGAPLNIIHLRTPLPYVPVLNDTFNIIPLRAFMLNVDDIAVLAPANEYDTQMGYIPADLADVATAVEDNTVHGGGSWETGGGSSDWGTTERKQIRDALGIDGGKTTASGGQLQSIDTNILVLETTISGIKERTDNLPDDPAMANEYDITVSGLEAKLDLIRVDLDNPDQYKATGFATQNPPSQNLDDYKADISGLPSAGEYDATLSGIQDDLDNPDQYKAEVGSLATEVSATINKNEIVSQVGINESKIDTAITNIDLLGTDISFIKEIEGGRWKIDKVNKKMLFYKTDNTTLIAVFNLSDENGNPSFENIFERTRFQ